ncbi:MAG: hypothetical protein AAF251_08390 [Pseudomonadota bacterium]
MPQDAPASLLSETGSYTRIGLRAAEPFELEDLLEQALDDGAERIVLELRPFLYRTGNQTSVTQCRGIRCQSKSALRTRSADATQLRAQFRAWYRDVRGLKPELDRIAFGQADPDKLDRVFDPSQKIQNRYPLKLLRWQDKSRLISLVNRAQAKGVDVVFIVYPRARAAHALIPKDQHLWVESQVRRLSIELCVDVFKPADIWGDSEFHDGAHVNQAGRDRIVRELAQWLANRT